MVPKRSQVTNLLVPVCFSASHVAYSSVRMEPQYMILGQAAGVAAAMAIGDKKAVQDIDTVKLTHRLVEQGAVIEYRPALPTPPTILQLFHKQTSSVQYSPEFFR